MNISDEAGKNSNAVQAKKLPSSILRKKMPFGMLLSIIETSCF